MDHNSTTDHGSSQAVLEVGQDMALVRLCWARIFSDPRVNSKQPVTLTLGASVAGISLSVQNDLPKPQQVDGAAHTAAPVAAALWANAWYLSLIHI